MLANPATTQYGQLTWGRGEWASQGTSTTPTPPVGDVLLIITNP